VVYPNFLYIGAPKAGSSWIFEVLHEHPDVFVPIAKDIQFFDYNYDKGIAWYLDFFRPGWGQAAVGELSHDYYLYPEVAARVHQHLPDIRLFCCLRDPISETMAVFLQQRKEFVGDDQGFGEYAFREETLKRSDYFYNLLPFYERFPRDKILALFFDELRRDPAAFIRQVYEFLQVDADFEPLSLHRRVLPASEPRSLGFAHLAYQTGYLLRKLGLANVVGTVKRNRVFSSLLYKPLDAKPEIPQEVEDRLREYYQQRYRNLPELIGRPLPLEWAL
jgi:hypothetical protein